MNKLQNNEISDLFSCEINSIKVKMFRQRKASLEIDYIKSW